jgi:DNA-binding response OmpR family regulator
MNKHIALIVEDDQDLATIFAEALQAANFETQIVRDGVTALLFLAKTQPEIVLLDLHLPRISGADILDKIKADERLAETKVMIATADPYMADSLREIADLVLIKPISFGQLRDLAARLRPPDLIG